MKCTVLRILSIPARILGYKNTLALFIMFPDHSCHCVFRELFAFGRMADEMPIWSQL
jgi:hypothetical protein